MGKERRSCGDGSEPLQRWRFAASCPKRIGRSLDGGKTWEPNHIVVIEHDTKPGSFREDNQYILSDTTPGPFAANLYVGWTLTDSKILLSRSLDDGKTAQPSFDGVVAPDGTLYVIWC